MLDRTKTSERTDSELIKVYQEKRDKNALNELVTRYLPIINKRMRRMLNNESDADELCHDVFVKVLKSFDSYQDDGRFHNYLNRVATNTYLDHVKKYRPEGDEFSSELEERFVDKEYGSSSPDNEAIESEKWEHFAKNCVPRLPAKERLVFLLQQESMLWDSNTNLSWSHVAELNGLDDETAWARFESARESFMKGVPIKDIDPEEVLIFLLWTEANRPFKKNRTLEHFADLLNEPLQNLRNRSFSAKKKLREHMEEFEC